MKTRELLNTYALLAKLAVAHMEKILEYYSRDQGFDTKGPKSFSTKEPMSYVKEGTSNKPGRTEAYNLILLFTGFLRAKFHELNASISAFEPYLTDPNLPGEIKGFISLFYKKANEFVDACRNNTKETTIEDTTIVLGFLFEKFATHLINECGFDKKMIGDFFDALTNELISQPTQNPGLSLEQIFNIQKTFCEKMVFLSSENSETEFLLSESERTKWLMDFFKEYLPNYTSLCYFRSVFDTEYDKKYPAQSEKYKATFVDTTSLFDLDNEAIKILTYGTLDETKKLIDKYGVDAWHEEKHKTLLFHLIKNRHHAKQMLLKFHYLLEKNANCSSPLLMALVLEKNKKQSSSENQMLTNYLIAALIMNGASLPLPSKEHEEKNEKETFWLYSILASNDDSCEKNTPLHAAIVKMNGDNQKNMAIIGLLMKNGANINSKNKFGRTPWDYAIVLRQSDPGILRLLKPEAFNLIDNIIADPNSKNPNLRSLVKKIKAKDLTPIFHSLAAETKGDSNELKYTEAQLKAAQQLIYQQFYLQQKTIRRFRTAAVVIAGIFLTPFSLAISIPLWRWAKRTETIQKRKVDKKALNEIQSTRRIIKGIADEKIQSENNPKLFNQTTRELKKVVVDLDESKKAIFMSVEQANTFDGIARHNQSKEKVTLFTQNHPLHKKLMASQEKSLRKASGIRH